MKLSLIALSLSPTLAHAAGIIDTRKPPQQPHPQLACSLEKANELVEMDIKANSTRIPDAVSFITTIQISGTKDVQGYASEAIFSYVVLDRDGRVVGLGTETLNGECQDQGGSFEGSTSGILPSRPLR
jgi:hypothetical protein